MGRKILLAAVFIALFITQGNAFAENLTTQYCRPLNLRDCPNEDMFYFDAPWHAAGGFYAYAIINTGTDEQVRYARIYDALADKLIQAKDFESLIIKKESQPHFIEFKLSTDDFQKNAQNEIRLKAVLGTKFGVGYDNEEGPVAISVGEGWPQIRNWYAGDIHYHTNYSRNAVEFGAPVDIAKKAAQEIGLDWIAITEHSFAFKEEEMPRLVQLAGEKSDSTFVFIPGEEVSTNSGPADQYRHFLAIGISNYIPGDEILANGGAKTLLPAKLIENANSQGGVGYVAHPYYSDFLRKEWQEEDYNLPFQGLQIWNYETWAKDTSELEKGLKKWAELLRNGRKVFIGGGSDAHGDFQILGKARTYAYTEDFSQRGIVEALRNGNSFITDGPLITAWINEATFGQEALVEEGAKVRVKIQFASNSYFGKVSAIEIWAGDNLVDTINPNSYFDSGLLWADKSTAADTYYRFAARTEHGYAAYTNPIWVKTFAKPRTEVIVKKEEKIAKEIKNFISPLMKMPSIIIKPFFHPIHSIDLQEIAERYKTDEMRKIDKLTSEALKKLNATSEPSIFEQKYIKDGQISGKDVEKDGKEYTVERHGGNIYYPD